VYIDASGKFQNRSEIGFHYCYPVYTVFVDRLYGEKVTICQKEGTSNGLSVIYCQSGDLGSGIVFRWRW
jgi:hypothetical protein